jgi:ABC-type transport system substrate-binding protein
MAKDVPITRADRSASFRYALPYGYTSLDPHRATSAGSQPWLSPIYDRLLTFRQGPNGLELAPQLATSYKVAADGLSISFVLRRDVTFQDGTAFNAAAVKANIERAKGPGSTVASQIASIQSVEVVDNRNVVFRLSQPDPGVPWSMAVSITGSMISPAALGNADLATRPVGSGPFKLVSAQKDADAVYERWDGHWDKDAALVQRLTISSITDNNVRYNGLRSGQFDGVYLAPPIDSQLAEQTAEGYHKAVTASPSFYGMLVNTALAPFNDVRVRKAVSMAINRKLIAKQLTGGSAQPMYQAFAPGYIGHDDSLDKDPYNPKKAQRLVQKAGATNATVRILHQTTSEPVSSMALVVQELLNDLGFKAELIPVSNTTARSTWLKGADHAWVTGSSGSPEPSQAVALSYLAGSQDNPAAPPAELVSMAAKAKTQRPGSNEEQKAYQEISRYLQENVLHIPITTLWATVVTRPNVIGSEHIMPINVGRTEFRYVGVVKRR